MSILGQLVKHCSVYGFPKYHRYVLRFQDAFGELAALVTVHDLRFAVSGQRFFQSFNAEVSFHAIGQSPAQNLAALPVHDGHQIEEPASLRDVADINTPDLVGAGDRQCPQQIGPDLMLRMLLAGVRCLIDRYQPHLAHQAAYPVATAFMALPLHELCRLT
jgi:hypothetical protein